jgi:hypothetical protein
MARQSNLSWHAPVTDATLPADPRARPAWQCKKERESPDGSKDENVFDIEQGVAVSLFTKRPGLERCIWRGDFWGKRLEKYKAAADGTLKSVNFDAIKPTAPQYLFLRQNVELTAEYARGVPVPGILSVNCVGVVTSRDRLAIHFTRDGLLRVVRDFVTRDAEDARGVYSLGKDAQDWRVAWAQEDVRASGPSDDCAVPILYRPFDTRWTYYTGKSSGFLVRPRPFTMRNMLSEDNLGLIITRVTKDKDTVFCTSVAAAHKSASVHDISYLFPLYLRAGHKEQGENVSTEFRSFLDAHYEHHYAPEEILGYIYAVLHAPTYRTRYAEFLRIDFPRVQFPDAIEDFEVLSGLGWALIQAHLLRELPRRGLAGYHGKGDHTVEAVRYGRAEQAIAINRTQSFNPVPQNVWEFRIGGYQVLDKYRKSRRGRMLSLGEIDHVGAVADSLAFTIDQMARIDEAYRLAFPEQA